MLRLEATRRVNPRLSLLGIFRNRVDPHNQESSGYAQLRDKYGDAVCERAVYVCPHTELCSERHLPVQLSEPQSRGADGYASLADELLGRMGVAHRKHSRYSNGEHRAPLRDVTPSLTENEHN
jgi:cellulose biosynthesis protein BcsQ